MAKLMDKPAMAVPEVSEAGLTQMQESEAFKGLPEADQKELTRKYKKDLITLPLLASACPTKFERAKTARVPTGPNIGGIDKTIIRNTKCHLNGGGKMRLNALQRKIIIGAFIIIGIMGLFPPWKANWGSRGVKPLGYSIVFRAPSWTTYITKKESTLGVQIDVSRFFVQTSVVSAFTLASLFLTKGDSQNR